jgi:hypothetical protein
MYFGLQDTKQVHWWIHESFCQSQQICQYIKYSFFQWQLLHQNIHNSFLINTVKFQLIDFVDTGTPTLTGIVELLTYRCHRHFIESTVSRANNTGESDSAQWWTFLWSETPMQLLSIQFEIIIYPRIYLVKFKHGKTAVPLKASGVQAKKVGIDPTKTCWAFWFFFGCYGRIKILFEYIYRFKFTRKYAEFIVETTRKKSSHVESRKRMNSKKC